MEDPAGASENDMSDTHDVQQALCDAADAIGRVWAAWAAQLSTEQRENLRIVFDEQGCRPGLRFIAGGPGREPQIAILLVDRAGEFHTATAVVFEDRATH